MNGKLFLALSSTLLLAAMLSVQIGNGVDLVTQWQLLWAQREASSFAEFNFLYGQLPRLVMTLLVGAMLGLVGSVMQQLTQNNLTSPLTLGTSSGAWLALIILNIGFPSLVASYSALAAMSGALLAFALVFANLFLGQSLLAAHWVTALFGSLLVLAALVVLGSAINTPRRV